MNRKKANGDFDEDEATPAKRRKVDNKELSFKTKVQNVLEKLADVAPSPFAVCGKLDAPMINIAIKDLKSVVHFPLDEGEAAEIIQLIEKSAYGTVRTTNVNGAKGINSWEMNSGGFEILNPAWNDFVNNEVVPKIKKEMFIDFSMTSSLHKLSVRKAGSYMFFDDSKVIDGTFATLVIQLPSRYKAGELRICHDNQSVSSDFSSNVFGAFYAAFYRGCRHGSPRLTEGYQVCLVYNLISRRSVIPTAPPQNPMELELANLMKKWEHCGKLVYALKHKYSESDLSFDNLKATDRSIANFLVYIAKTTDLNVFLATLNKESSGQSAAVAIANFEFDSDDEDVSRWKSYNLSKLIAVDGTNMLTTPLTVQFDAEVFPEDCFANIDPYRKKLKPTDSAGVVDITRFHSCTAIVVWPKRFLFEVPRKNGASSADLDKIFLKEIEMYRGQTIDDTDKMKLKNWAKEIISTSKGKKSIDFIKAVVEMKDVQLIQSLFSCGMRSPGIILNEVSISLVVDVCEKYGWKTFVDQIPEMFGSLKNEDRIELLGRIGTAEMDDDKKVVVQRSMEVIMKRSYFFPAQKNEEREFLLSVCRLAERMNVEIFDILKVKSIESIVPVLLQLVPNDSGTLSPFWKDLALHFVREMLHGIAKPVHSWRRNDRTDCSCKDCSPVNAFLASEQKRISFTIGKDRRVHLCHKMRKMENISLHENTGGHCGSLVIQKTSESRTDEDTVKRSLSLINLPKLLAILPQ